MLWSSGCCLRQRTETVIHLLGLESGVLYSTDLDWLYQHVGVLLYLTDWTYETTRQVTCVELQQALIITFKSSRQSKERPSLA